MVTFTIVTGIASILGLIFSITATVQAGRASRAAAAARDAAMVRTLVDELQQACTRAEQLVDFLAHGRFGEASLRADELMYSLSELPHRRSNYLSDANTNALMTSREQLHSIGQTVADRARVGFNPQRVTSVARLVVQSLHEVLGQVRSRIESGE